LRRSLLALPACPQRGGLDLTLLPTNTPHALHAQVLPVHAHRLWCEVQRQACDRDQHLHWPSAGDGWPRGVGSRGLGAMPMHACTMHERQAFQVQHRW